MFPKQPMPFSKRALTYRILCISLFGCILMWTIDTCKPISKSSTVHTISSFKDSIVHSIQEIQQEIVCSDVVLGTGEAKRVFKVQHYKNIYMYVSGKSEILMEKDTMLLGVISADIGCPKEWNTHYSPMFP